jgi:DNA mismatch repair protein MutL
VGRIRVLDDHLANQIAAGEVVERPSSVVKELVENSIDAEATRIQVRIEEGGISLIRVSDNGTGMDRDDAVLAFSRHATSKIRKERDLFAIRTLGFRGEALPSIASVARVTLTTASDPAMPATRVRIEGGEIISVEDTNRSRGTDVEVRDLFYNTPARLKYLKTVNTEVSHVADAVSRLALAHPGIAFSLSHNSRELFRTSGDGKQLHVLHALYGRQVSAKMVHFTAEDMDFEIEGYVTRPEITRSTRSHLSVILNGRFVRSGPIVQAVLRAYGTLLPSGRYPVGVLSIRMDPKLVDVNVHPAKLEVRLSKEKECCDLVERALKDAFRGVRFVPSVSGGPGEARIRRTMVIQDALNWDLSPVEEGSSAPPLPERPEPMREPTYKQPQPQVPFLPGRMAEPERIPMRERDEEVRNRSDSGQSVNVGGTVPRPQSPVSSAESRPLTDSEAGREEKKGEVVPNRRIPAMEPLTQVHGTYIVAQSADGFYLIDQHAAHERIYYEKFSRKMAEECREQQPLLIPLTIECSPAEAEILEMHVEDLRRWGLDIEPFGGNTYLVRAYPSWFPREDAVALIREIIDWLKENGKVETARLRDAGAKMMACKAAIKANRHLRRDEMEALISQLEGCDNPFTCPHGRPIFVHFSTYDLEKMFKRVM